MTGFSLKMLREGKLNAVINAGDSSVLNVINDFYMGLFYQFYIDW